VLLLTIKLSLCRKSRVFLHVAIELCLSLWAWGLRVCGSRRLRQGCSDGTALNEALNITQLLGLQPRFDWELVAIEILLCNCWCCAYGCAACLMSVRICGSLSSRPMTSAACVRAFILAEFVRAFWRKRWRKAWTQSWSPCRASQLSESLSFDSSLVICGLSLPSVHFIHFYVGAFVAEYVSSWTCVSSFYVMCCYKNNLSCHRRVSVSLCFLILLTVCL